MKVIFEYDQLTISDFLNHFSRMGIDSAETELRVIKALTSQDLLPTVNTGLVQGSISSSQ